MYRLSFVVAAFALCARAALGAGYDDFSAGLNANLRGDSARAVKAFSAAIASPDLVPAYRATALRGRAVAYLALDKCEEAWADIDAYVASKPVFNDIAYLNLSGHLCRKDAASASKDFDLLTVSKPNVADLWRFCRWEWRYGLYREAADVAKQAFKKIDKESSYAGYILLWYALSAERAGNIDRNFLSESAAQWGEGDWPRPILDFYQKKLPIEGLKRAAENWRDVVEISRRCEADFYVAEAYLTARNMADAKPLLLEAIRICPMDYVEYEGARRELKNLKVDVPEE